MACDYDTGRPLHSTMFLLIPEFGTIAQPFGGFFTFHNVSINTMIPFQMMQDAINFTFHNVSINTVAYGMAETAPISVFTFHNVSINTYSDRRS